MFYNPTVPPRRGNRIFTPPRPTMSTWRSTKAPPEALRAKFPCKLETTSQGSQGAKLAANGAKLAAKRRRRRAIRGTFTSKSRPLFLKFFSRWLSSFSLSAMLASSVGVGCYRTLAMRLVSSSPFSALRSLTIFCCRVRGAYWECRWRRAASLRSGRVGKPPPLPLAPLTSARPRARVGQRTFLIHTPFFFYTYFAL